ncbi:MAG: hypothetical protein Q9182_000283 [Xanthomendoza sp. 2 TL-2023]
MGGSTPEYWGYLVNSDKNPSPIFEQLLLGIANYISRQIAPWDIPLLTPTKLAAFYRLVGGDLDSLFLETPQASLSFIYQSLGCFHTLQPEKDPYSAPAVPALTALGFVRWQTVQLLLEPNEHASFLQNAVKRLDIINPADGTPFPDRLPREALPSRPDPEMIQWHQGVAESLMTDSHDADDTRGYSATEHAQISDTTTESSIASSDDRQSLIDTARNYTHPRPKSYFQPPPSINLPQSIDRPPIGNHRNPYPDDPEPHRSNASHMRSPETLPFAQHSFTLSAYPTQNSPDHSRPRRPSTVSTSSVSSSSLSSLTTSSASMSPRHHLDSHHHTHAQPDHQPPSHRPYHHGRRHSSHGPYSPREAPGASDDQAHSAARNDIPLQQPPRQMVSNPHALNVQWGNAGFEMNTTRRLIDEPHLAILPRSLEPQMTGEDMDSARRSRNGNGGRLTGPLRGVGGRRYVA